jgi:hypothetical protein
MGEHHWQDAAKHIIDALPTNAPATTLTVGAVPWLRMKIA